MNVASLLTLAALAAVVVLGPRLLRRVRAPARRRVGLHDGVLRMRAPRRYAIALGICALVPAGVLGAMALRLGSGGRAGARDLVEIAAATAVALAVAAWLFAGAFRNGFVADAFGLTRVGVLRSRRVRWGDVASVKYNPASQWFFVTGADGSHLWIPVDTHGIADFAALALDRLPAAALRADDLARDALEELAAPPAS